MSRAKGFTLVEVMVALTLLSLIMVATIAAMRTFGNTKTTIQQVTNRVDEVRVVSGFLRNTLGGAVPVARTGAFGDSFEQVENTGTYFWGGPTEIIWVSPLVAGANLGGAFVMRMAYVDGRLELKWHPYEATVGAYNWGELEPRVLLDNVEAFELGYLPAYGGDWVQDWPGSVLNPVSVRLNIKARERYWPELVVRLDAPDARGQIVRDPTSF